jgi:hypothetical protein
MRKAKVKKVKIPIVEVSPGDIVSYNPNDSLRTYGIVCDVRDDGLVYIVPFTSTKSKEPDSIYLPFNAENDFWKFDSSVKEGTVLLAVGKMVFKRCIAAVVGRCTSVFFHKVCVNIPLAVNFTGDVIDYTRNPVDYEEEAIATPDDADYNPHVPFKIGENGLVIGVGNA